MTAVTKRNLYLWCAFAAGIGIGHGAGAHSYALAAVCFVLAFLFGCEADLANYDVAREARDKALFDADTAYERGKTHARMAHWDALQAEYARGLRVGLADAKVAAKKKRKKR